MNKKFSIITCDAIGTEVSNHSIQVLKTIAKTFHHEFEFENFHTAVTDTIQKLKQFSASDIALLCLSDESQFQEIKKELPFLSILHPLKSYSSLNHLSPLKNKNSEGFNIIIVHHSNTKDSLEKSLEIVAHWAMDRRNKITLVTNETSNKINQTAEIILSFKQNNPEIIFEEMPVLTIASELISNPRQFDVLLVNDMPGEMIYKEAAAFCNAQNLMPFSIITGENTLFGSITKTADQYLGRDLINPICSIFSIGMMLYHLGMDEEATTVKNAVNWTIQNGFVTKDIDPVNFYFSSTITELICDYINGKVPDVVIKENIELRKSTII